MAQASRPHPHLAVIDRFKDMQGNEPVDGAPVDYPVCVMSTDWLTADRVGAERIGLRIG